MTFVRWMVLQITILAAALLPAAAQPHSTTPLRIVVPNPPGAAVDLLARMLGDYITTSTGRAVVIDNRAGGGGNLAMDLVARSAPDGNTLLMASGGHITTNRLLYKNTAVDPMTDLLPIAQVATIKLIIAVNKDVPAKSLREFIDLARSKPGAINYTSAGPGSTTHLAGDQFMRLAGLDLVHIPHRGAGPAVVDVVAGNVQMITLGVNTLAPYILSGELRALATASPKRLPYPDVPTAAEAGLPGWDVEVWFGLFGPRGLPREIADAMNGLVQKLAESPLVQKRMQAAYMENWKMSADEFAAYVKTEGTKWERIIKDAGIKPQ